jgi:membrane-bound inhibitor of C-type lysozyme/uncharacterized membrane protein
MVANTSINRFLNPLLIVLLIAGLSACESAEDVPPPSAGEPEMEPILPGFRMPMTFAYSCRGDIEFVIRIEPDQDYLTILIDERTLRLQPTASPVGARYEAENIVFWLRDNVAVLYRDGHKHVNCLENRRLSLIEDARYRGVSVWGVGNRPDWRVEVGPNHILLETTAGTELHVFPLDTTPDITDTKRNYASDNNDNDIVIAAEAKQCYDNLSNVTYDTTLTVQFNDQFLHGCGIILK